MISRRTTLAALAATMATTRVHAQAAFPDKPIKVLVPFGPGGLADITVRVVAEKMSAILGQQLVIVNQPGAGGIAAAKAVLAAPADGYTLALFTNGTAISVPLVKELGFDPVAQFQPVSSLGFFDFLMLAGADSGYKTLGDVLAAAKTKSGGLNIATINIGSTQNLTAELFKSAAGAAMTIVPYKTSPDAITAVIRKDVDLVIDGYAAARAMLQDKRVVALATTGGQRSPLWPDVPTVQEGGLAGFDVTSWNALFTLAGTPQPVVAKLNEAINTALADETVIKKLFDLGIVAKGGKPSDIGDRLKSDIAKWGSVIEKAGIPKQ